MKFAWWCEPEENCCMDDTVGAVLARAKLLISQRKRPESAVSSASRPL
jgi:hypothetical protein